MRQRTLARDHTARFLAWWERAGIVAGDLAVRRARGTWIWHRGLPLDALHLGWARAENLRGSDIYVRPARGRAWPLVFLDDVPPSRAATIAQRVSALAVHTSPEGGCQLWLRTRTALEEDQRYRAQRALALRVGADLGSISGEHLGRLAGFRNQKRAGVWVNVVAESVALPALDAELLGDQPRGTRAGRARPPRRGTDHSPSAHEWGWVCRMLERATPAHEVLRALTERARPRRGADAERYAQRTVARAMAHVRSSLPQGGGCGSASGARRGRWRGPR